jgi:hypothetical protein
VYVRDVFHRPPRKVTFNSDPIRVDTKREITQKQPPPPHLEAHTGSRSAQPTAFSRAPLVVAPSERTDQLARPRKVTPKFPMQTTVAFGRTVHVDDGNKERVGLCFKCVCILTQQESPPLGLASLQSERNVLTVNKLSNTNKINAKQPTVTATTKKAAESGTKASNGNTRSCSPVVVSPTPAQMRDESLQTISSAGSDPAIVELKDMVGW